jgi:predicted esterase
VAASEERSEHDQGQSSSCRGSHSAILTPMPRREEIEVVAATTRGRSILSVPDGDGPFPLMVGFHGYAESAEDQMKRMRALPGSERLILLSVQGLHWFYNRAGQVVAGWMTRLNREEAIADNLAWVGSAVERAMQEAPSDGRIVWSGFSQGAAMAWRAAAFLQPRATALVVLGGDVPPDVGSLGAQEPGRLPPILVGRGVRDEFYPGVTFERDLATLEAIGARFETAEFDGGHEWNEAFSRAVGAFLDVHLNLSR